MFARQCGQRGNVAFLGIFSCAGGGAVRLAQDALCMDEHLHVPYPVAWRGLCKSARMEVTTILSIMSILSKT